MNREEIANAIEAFKVKYPQYDIIFANVSGAHLYGTATEKSDIDLRGCYVVPTGEVVGLKGFKDTIEMSVGNVEIQFHELGKFLRLMVKPNVNFIEELRSPLEIVTSDTKEAMLVIAEGVISKKMFKHIQGMTVHTKKHADKEHFGNPKRNIYLIRELLRGIVLFKNGSFMSDVRKLATVYDLLPMNAKSVDKMEEHVMMLIDMKRVGVINMIPATAEISRLWVNQLEREMSVLKDFGVLRAEPDESAFRKANALLLKVRKRNWK